MVVVGKVLQLKFPKDLIFTDQTKLNTTAVEIGHRCLAWCVSQVLSMAVPVLLLAFSRKFTSVHKISPMDPFPVMIISRPSAGRGNL